MFIVSLLTTPSVEQRSPLFAFRAGFWTNVHHFLYVLGRDRNRAPDRGRDAVVNAPKDVEGLSDRPEAERAAWDEAIRFYAADLSKKDAVFDETLVAITRALARLPDDGDPAAAGIDPALARTLVRVAPVYRAVWWPRHSAANAALQRDAQAWLDKFGRPAVERLTAIYGTAWPSTPRVIDLAAYTNWAGAYSTTGPLIVVASTDPRMAGSIGLEILLHESSHQWDDEIEKRLAAAAARRGTRVPDQLSHALIWYSTGYVITQLVPGHVPYAEKYGLWKSQGLAALKPLVDRDWLPYLEGRGTFDEAIASVLTPHLNSSTPQLPTNFQRAIRARAALTSWPPTRA